MKRKRTSPPMGMPCSHHQRIKLQIHVHVSTTQFNIQHNPHPKILKRKEEMGLAPCCHCSHCSCLCCSLCCCFLFFFHASAAAATLQSSVAGCFWMLLPSCCTLLLLLLLFPLLLLLPPLYAELRLGQQHCWPAASLGQTGPGLA